MRNDGPQAVDESRKAPQAAEINQGEPAQAPCETILGKTILGMCFAISLARPLTMAGALSLGDPDGSRGLGCHHLTTITWPPSMVSVAPARRILRDLAPEDVIGVGRVDERER